MRCAEVWSTGRISERVTGATAGALLTEECSRGCQPGEGTWSWGWKPSQLFFFFFFFLHSFNGNRRVCCVELDIVFRELYFGVSIVKSGRILGANKIMVRASVGGGGPDGVG